MRRLNQSHRRLAKAARQAAIDFADPACTPPHSGSSFRYALVAQIFAYAGVGDYLSDRLVGVTGFITQGRQGGLDIVDCQVVVVDALCYNSMPLLPTPSIHRCVARYSTRNITPTSCLP